MIPSKEQKDVLLNFSMSIIKNVGLLAERASMNEDCRKNICGIYMNINAINRMLDIDVSKQSNITVIHELGDIREEIIWLGYGLTSELLIDSDTGNIEPNFTIELIRLKNIAKYFGYDFDECIRMVEY